MDIYTDGSSIGNPGPAGWACMIGDEIYSGGLPHATNNEAELRAVYEALKLAPPQAAITICTDSKLVVGWLNLGWKMRYQHIRDLYTQICQIMIEKHITLRCRKVQGHSFDIANGLVDARARKEAKAQARDLILRPS